MRFRWPFALRCHCDHAIRLRDEKVAEMAFQATRDQRRVSDREREIARLKADIARLEGDSDAAAAHVRNLRQEARSARETLDRALAREMSA